MLALHECTFEVRYTGWGAYSALAEGVAEDILLDLLNMSPDSVQRLARSKRELTLTAKVARARIATMLARRGRPVPQKGDIKLMVIACPKV